MKKQVVYLLFLGLMSQAIVTLGGPVRPRPGQLNQNAQARRAAGRLLPPPVPANRR